MISTPTGKKMFSFEMKQKKGGEGNNKKYFFFSLKGVIEQFNCKAI
jgi:hypothetical protein